VLPASLAAFDVVFYGAVGGASDAAPEFAAAPEVAAPVLFPQVRKPFEQLVGARTLQLLKHIRNAYTRLETQENMHVVGHNLHGVNHVTVFCGNLPQNLFANNFYATNQNTVRVFRLPNKMETILPTTMSSRKYVHHCTSKAVARPWRIITAKLTLGKQNTKTSLAGARKNLLSSFHHAGQRPAVFKTTRDNKNTT